MQNAGGAGCEEEPLCVLLPVALETTRGLPSSARLYISYLILHPHPHHLVYLTASQQATLLHTPRRLSWTQALCLPCLIFHLWLIFKSLPPNTYIHAHTHTYYNPDGIPLDTHPHQAPRLPVGNRPCCNPSGQHWRHMWAWTYSSVAISDSGRARPGPAWCASCLGYLSTESLVRAAMADGLQQAHWTWQAIQGTSLACWNHACTRGLGICWQPAAPSTHRLLVHAAFFLFLCMKICVVSQIMESILLQCTHPPEILVGQQARIIFKKDRQHKKMVWESATGGFTLFSISERLMCQPRSRWKAQGTESRSALPIPASPMLGLEVRSDRLAPT